ncbi:MAG: PBP1A family penicillin-binding protein [Phascolarctobacterium sp.]|nr:PBP1A family penicillin-binding protein [Phascolarctobacterium sp.]
MFSILKTLLIFISSVMIMAVSVWYGFSGMFAPKNMDEQLQPDAASEFYDSKGSLIYTTLSEERRIPININYIPDHTQKAFIAIEDNRFYDHLGVDFRGTARAVVSTLSGREVQGGSTITQQLAKNAFLTQERTITRKVKEAFLARELEKRYTKDEILEMYLNHIYFGQGAYGVESAARYYFNKEAKDLNIAESATLAAIPKSPNYFNPFENPKASKERQELVIDQMVKYGFITEAQGEAAKKEELKLATTAKKREDNPNFYFIDMITQKVIDELGAEALYKGGLKVYTTLDSDMQRAAIESLKHLPAPVAPFMEEKDLEKLKEDEHPVAYNDKNKLTQPQVALVAIDPNTGHVKAMLGGRGQDKFNRATLSVRQPGSSFKPFVYLTGMANGFTPASIMEDKEEEFDKDWRPRNVTKKWYGKVTLRTAIARSMNIPTIRLAREVGVRKVVETAQKMGISTLETEGKYTDANLSMAIGGLSHGVSPLEMASAYGVFATNGILCKPFALLKITDANGQTLYENETVAKRVMDPKPIYSTVDMMKDVLIWGSGGGMGIGRPAAGKTGTTDNYVDAWFVGFTPDLSTAVWVGDDNNRTLDNMSGSGTPLSIWHDFMIKAHKDIPVSDFVNPGVEIPPEPVILQDETVNLEKEMTRLAEEEKAKEKAREELKKERRKESSKEKEREELRRAKEKEEREEREREREKKKRKEEEKKAKEKARKNKNKDKDDDEDKPVVSNKPTRRSMKDRIQDIAGQKE